MNKIIFIKGVQFKQFRDTKYYCDQDGNVYSDFSQKILKPMKRKNKSKEYYYIDINFGKGQKHYPIHHMVYETWIGPIPEEQIIRHKDDDSLNNNIDNLCCGNQKENIQDCIKNSHRVGNCWILTVYDKENKQTITFCPAKDFIEYSKHSCRNGSLQRIFSRKWFKQRYEIIDYSFCKNLFMKNSVTTMSDECNSVGYASEAHD